MQLASQAKDQVKVKAWLQIFTAIHDASYGNWHWIWTVRNGWHIACWVTRILLHCEGAFPTVEAGAPRSTSWGQPKKYVDNNDRQKKIIILKYIKLQTYNLVNEVFHRYHSLTRGVLFHGLPLSMLLVLWRAMPLKTPFGLVIPFITNSSHVTTIIHNYFLCCVTSAQLTNTHAFVTKVTYNTLTRLHCLRALL
jgi:hypothetical protein